MTDPRLPGAILRMERQRQGLMLKQVCQGICVTSYLSKIEHGDAKADSDILAALFARLGIVYTADEAVLSPLREAMADYHDRNLYGLDKKATYNRLMADDLLLTYSPLCADWLIIRGLEGEDVLPQLDTLADCLTARQKAWRDLLWTERHMHAPESMELASAAAAVLGNSLSLIHLCAVAFERSDYAVIHRMESRITALALEEGNVYMLGCYYEYKGGAHACLNQEDMMMTCYERAIHLLRNTGWADRLSGIYYNIGATQIGLKKYDLALKYLSMAEGGDARMLTVRHKQAMACIRAGRMADAAAYLDMMKAELDADPGASEGDRLWYEEAVMECSPDFLDDPAYLALLERLFAALRREAHFGYLYFYRDVYTEACIRQRQYKKALALEQEISSVARNSNA